PAAPWRSAPARSRPAGKCRTGPDRRAACGGAPAPPPRSRPGGCGAPRRLEHPAQQVPHEVLVVNDEDDRHGAGAPAVRGVRTTILPTPLIEIGAWKWTRIFTDIPLT